MPSRASTSLLLKNRFLAEYAFIVCQCPLGLVPHCYRVTQKEVYYDQTEVSMPSRASTSLLPRGVDTPQMTTAKRVNALSG